MIDRGALDRVSAWVDEAVQAGAEVLTGAKREDPFYLPTVLANTDASMKVRCEEIFGPVVSVGTYSDFDEAIAEVNDSFFGLQTGVFTNDLEHAWRAFHRLEVGGVIVNDIPTYRIDHMPYGGVKDSGLGREGLRWAIEDMTEVRIMVLAWPG